MAEIRQLTAAGARQHVSALADVLIDCVHGGASVSFMAAITQSEAIAFFQAVIDGVERGERILLAAFVEAELVGTVHLIKAPAPNQPHRADIAKLLVRRSARGQGIASSLMRAVEQASLSIGRTLLVLDTVTGASAERLYLKLGWQRAGVIPHYALYPDGRWCDTTIFWKWLTPAASTLEG